MCAYQYYIHLMLIHCTRDNVDESYRNNECTPAHAQIYQNQLQQLEHHCLQPLTTAFIFHHSWVIPLQLCIVMSWASSRATPASPGTGSPTVDLWELPCVSTTSGAWWSPTVKVCKFSFAQLVHFHLTLYCLLTELGWFAALTPNTVCFYTIVYQLSVSRNHWWSVHFSRKTVPEQLSHLLH